MRAPLEAFEDRFRLRFDRIQSKIKGRLPILRGDIPKRINVEPYTPRVFADKMNDLLNVISEGKWELPESDGSRAEKKLYRLLWEGQIGNWLDMLRKADIGLDSVREAQLRHLKTGNHEYAQALHFVEWGRMLPLTHEKIASVRRGFAALLGKKEQRRLHLRKEAALVTGDDKALTKTFVNSYRVENNLVNLSRFSDRPYNPRSY